MKERPEKAAQSALASQIPLARARGAYQNRTGVNGFAGLQYGAMLGFLKPNLSFVRQSMRQ